MSCAESEKVESTGHRAHRQYTHLQVGQLLVAYGRVTRQDLGQHDDLEQERYRTEGQQ